MPREPDPERMRVIPSETEVAIDPEILEQIQDLYDEEDQELYDPDQPRAPAGSSEGGQWTSGGGSPAAAEPKIYHTPDEVIQTKGDWGSNKMVWYWKSDDGKPSGRLLKTPPREKRDLPAVLYHMTLAGKALEQAPMLLGRTDAGGLGGGTENGVSFTTSYADARMLQREMRRVIEISKNHAQVPALLHKYASEDEQINNLPPGALDNAVKEAIRNYEFNYKLYPTPSTAKDAISMYFQARTGQDYLQIMRPESTSQLKNPIVFGSGKHFATLDPADVTILAVPRDNIPDKALITGGSDEWLNEVRVHADVPLKGARVGHKADLHLMEWPFLAEYRLHMGPGDHPNGTPQSVHGTGGGAGEGGGGGEAPKAPPAPYPALRTEPMEPPLPHAQDPWKPSPKAPSPPQAYPTLRAEPEEPPLPHAQDPWKSARPKAEDGDETVYMPERKAVAAPGYPSSMKSAGSGSGLVVPSGAEMSPDMVVTPPDKRIRPPGYTGPIIGELDPNRDTRKVHQPFNTVEDNLREAERWRPDLDKIVDDLATLPGVQIARGSKGEINRARVKQSRERIQEKLDKGRDPRNLTDYLGGRIRVRTPQAMMAVIKRLHQSGVIITEDDNFLTQPKDGYRARHLQVQFPSGFTAELQMVPDPIQRVQNEGHGFYDVLRSPKSTKEAVERAKRESERIFGNAWKASAWATYKLGELLYFCTPPDWSGLTRLVASRTTPASRHSRAALS